MYEITVRWHDDRITKYKAKDWSRDDQFVCLDPCHGGSVELINIQYIAAFNVDKLVGVVKHAKDTEG